MMKVQELRNWLDRLQPDECVGVDEGGLAIITSDGRDYLEIGGIPEDDDEESGDTAICPDCGLEYQTKIDGYTSVCPSCSTEVRGLIPHDQQDDREPRDPCPTADECPHAVDDLAEIRQAEEEEEPNERL